MSVFDVPVFLGLTRQMEPGGEVSESKGRRGSPLVRELPGGAWWSVGAS